LNSHFILFEECLVEPCPNGMLPVYITLIKCVLLSNAYINIWKSKITYDPLFNKFTLIEKKDYYYKTTAFV